MSFQKKSKYRYEEEFQIVFSSLLLRQKKLLDAYQKRKMAKENLDIADKEFHEAINFANSNESENPNNLAMKLKVNI